MKHILPSYLMLICSFLMIQCASNDFGVPNLDCQLPEIKETKDVLSVHQTAQQVIQKYEFDDVIQAYVTSTDENGNFFKSISFQTKPDQNGNCIGFSIPIDLSNSYLEFREGNKCSIKLKNLFLDLYNGGLRIGNSYVDANGKATIGRISAAEYNQILFPSCIQISESELIRKLDLANVKQDKNINTLVEISDISFETKAIGHKLYEESQDIGGATNWQISDINGEQIVVRTSNYSRFSSFVIPEKKGKIKGVLTKFGKDYQIILRKIEDLELTENKNKILFEEDFQMVTDNQNLSLPNWTNVSQAGTKVWMGTFYANNGCAEFNAQTSSNVSNLAWLISPEIDLDKQNGEILTFRTAQHHLDIDSPNNSLKLFYTTDYNGSNLTIANWKELPAKFATQSTPWYEFVGSGGIDLSGISGKIRLGFLFTGSGKDALLDGAFQLDDVKISYP